VLGAARSDWARRTNRLSTVSSLRDGNASGPLFVTVMVSVTSCPNGTGFGGDWTVLTTAWPDAAAGEIASADATSAIAAALRTTPRASLRPLGALGGGWRSVRCRGLSRVRVNGGDEGGRVGAVMAFRSGAGWVRAG
jgi:hypothetical protein